MWIGCRAIIPRSLAGPQLSQKKPSERDDSNFTLAFRIGVPDSSKTRTSARPIPSGALGAMPWLGGLLSCGDGPCATPIAHAARMMRNIERNLNMILKLL